MCLFELRISGAEHLREPLNREEHRRHGLEHEEHRLHARHYLGLTVCDMRPALYAAHLCRSFQNAPSDIRVRDRAKLTAGIDDDLATLEWTPGARSLSCMWRPLILTLSYKIRYAH